jgi:glycosyltransferase involved in cell wall biosynthesis
MVTVARAPPQIGGTPTVMYELLRHFPKGSVVLVTKHQGGRTSADDRVLDVPTVTVARAGAFVYPTLFQLLLMPLTFVEMLLAARRARPGSILAVFPSLDFLLCSLVLGRLTNAPVFVYLHDCVVETAGTVERRLARIAEEWAFSKASKVYSMSGPMKAFYEAKGLRTEVLPHGLDPSLERHPVPGRRTGALRIGFSGGIYENNLQALSDLIETKERSPGVFEVHVTAPAQSIELLRSRGLLGRLDSASTLPTQDDVLDFLAGCDLLFIPMSFESKVREDLLTIFPTKVTDYWLAGRPIMVYGPREYAFVPLAERDGYAVVVSERSPERLAEAIKALAGSPETAERLAAASRDMVRRHDGSMVAKRLMEDLGLPGTKG